MKIKYKCALCDAEYALLGFTNHVQRTHKIKYKDYYDTYIEPNTEHICRFCGKPCDFSNSHGYYETCNSSYCVRKQQHETMYERYGNSCRHADKVKQKPVIEYKFNCALCGRGFKNHAMLNRHLIQEHSAEITTEEYYLKFLNGKVEYCEICGKPAKWLGTHYHNVCGSAACTHELRSRNNAMNNEIYRKRVSEGLKSIPPERKAEIRKQVEETCLEKFGYRHNWASPEMRENGQYKTCLEKYGDRNYHNIEQMQNTCMEHFGVRSFSQTAEFQGKMWHKFKKDGITFDSSYEYAFYNFLKCIKKDFKYHPKVKFAYEFNGKTHYFFPDFFIDGQYYEVKGEYLYKCMLVENTKDNAKLQCIIKNKINLITSCDILAFINSMFNKNITQETMVDKCLTSEFPGTAKWPDNHPIWDCFVPGYMEPRTAWKDKTLVTRAVKNMIKTINDSLVAGKYESFCIRYINAIINDNYLDKVLDRFTIAKIAPKVTALSETELAKIIKETNVDLSSGVYCPMAGFGGIVRGAAKWFKDHNLPAGIEAYDINKSFCDWYGWTQRDVLAQTITTEKTVIVCPPFGKEFEHWKGTPDEMSDISFIEWVDLIKEHVKAPKYIFIGPEMKSKNKCGLFSKKTGISYYDDAKLAELANKG